METTLRESERDLMGSSVFYCERIFECINNGQLFGTPKGQFYWLLACVFVLRTSTPEISMLIGDYYIIKISVILMCTLTRLLVDRFIIRESHVIGLKFRPKDKTEYTKVL